MNTAEKIKKARLDSKLTQKELAQMCETTQTTITHIEAGETKNTSIDIALKIANALNKNINYLFGDDDNNSHIPSEAQNKQIIEKLQSENEAYKQQLENYQLLINLLKSENERLHNNS